MGSSMRITHTDTNLSFRCCGAVVVDMKAADGSPLPSLLLGMHPDEAVSSLVHTQEVISS